MRIQQVDERNRGLASRTRNWRRLYDGFAELRFVATLRNLARARGRELVAPVLCAPTAGDGLLFDPWRRPRLAGLDGHGVPESGSYVVPGARVPVEADVERDLGLDLAPCVRMRHA